MKKLKNILQNVSGQYKHTAARYPVTMVLILLTSIFAAVFIDQSNDFCKFMEEKGLPFMMLWDIGAYFAETFLSEKKSMKWLCIAAGGLIAFGLVRLGNSSSETIEELASSWQITYIIMLITLGVYRNYQKSGLPFNQYCIRVVYELSELSIICSIAALGIVLVTATFAALILNGSHYTLIFRAEFLIVGFLFGCGLLKAQINTDRDLPRFFILIVKYLLMVLLLAAFAIIYGYILKIIITRVVPSNEIFRILAGLFIIGLPIWTLVGTFDEDQWPVRIGTKLPYIFIPFLFLQGYAIRERIAAYGITPLRYLCLALMLFEVIYIIVYAVRKRETGIMLPVFAVMAVICLVLPAVNMYSISNRSQKAILDRYIGEEFSSLSDEDQSSLAGAYYYLTENAAGKAMLADIDPEKIEEIKASGKIGIPEYDRNIHIAYEFPVIDRDIRAYSRMTMVTNENAAAGIDKENYDPEKIDLYDSEGNPVLTVDLRGFFNRCISASPENRFGTPDFPGEIELDDGNVLLITNCTCGMNIDPEMNIEYLYLDAILLEKE